MIWSRTIYRPHPQPTASGSKVLKGIGNNSEKACRFQSKTACIKNCCIGTEFNDWR